MKKTYTIIIGICLWLVPNHLTGQIDLKTGYIASFHNYSALDDIVDQYNLSTESRLDDLKSLNLVHGIDLGMRYTSDDIAYVFGYQFSLNGSRVKFLNNTQAETKLRYRLHGINAGMEGHFGSFGVGTALQFNIFKIRGETGSNGYTSLSSKNYFSAKLYLILSGNNISLQPFIDIPFGQSQNLDGVSEFLGVDSVRDQKIPLVFGIKLLLYNRTTE